MNDTSFQLLAQHGIKCEEGLTIEEIQRIEALYDIEFPPSLRAFLQVCLPVSRGFYNWRDFSEQNTEAIRNMINYPNRYIWDTPDSIYWPDEWGNEPQDPDVFAAEVRKRLSEAATLIPVYAHRYIPAVAGEPPVFSIHGGDVIIYGETLDDYFQIEFGKRQQESVDVTITPYISFWSDLL